jgi:hypothetical protein
VVGVHGCSLCMSHCSILADQGHLARQPTGSDSRHPR